MSKRMSYEEAVKLLEDSEKIVTFIEGLPKHDRDQLIFMVKHFDRLKLEELLKAAQDTKDSHKIQYATAAIFLKVNTEAQ